ncbi:hypothetical protein Taro_012271 [Colocasia esculenta]|uniref:Uncharacterized protein n=1 Tax=Colocasia esculenta TaxID=4460 RepID=A0A843UCF8_COLES|nr:hypothetical protein [Colocasia esculenta]
MEEAPSQGEQSIIEPEVSEFVAEGHFEKVVLKDAPAQGEQESVELPTPIQGEQVGIEEIPPPASVPGSEDPSASNINLEEPITQQGKQKRIVFRRPRKGHRKGVVPFWAKEDLVVSRVVVFPFRLKEDQLRVGARIREGDSTLFSEILRHCSGTGRIFELPSEHGHFVIFTLTRRFRLITFLNDLLFGS